MHFIPWLIYIIRYTYNNSLRRVCCVDRFENFHYLKFRSKWVLRSVLARMHDVANDDGWVYPVYPRIVFICSSKSTACWRGGETFTRSRMLLITAWSMRRKEGGNEVKVVYHPWPRQLPFDTLRLRFKSSLHTLGMFRHCSRKGGATLLQHMIRQERTPFYR